MNEDWSKHFTFMISFHIQNSPWERLYFSVRKQKFGAQINSVDFTAYNMENPGFKAVVPVVLLHSSHSGANFIFSPSYTSCGQAFSLNPCSLLWPWKYSSYLLICCCYFSLFLLYLWLLRAGMHLSHSKTFSSSTETSKDLVLLLSQAFFSFIKWINLGKINKERLTSNVTTNWGRVVLHIINCRVANGSFYGC